MKKILLALLVLASVQVSAQKFPGIDKSIMDVTYYPIGAHGVAFAKTLEAKAALTPRIKVIYSRPLVNGRTVFGDLVKFNEDWRFGANESTEIDFYTPVQFGETILAPGRYTLYCIPKADTWTLKIHPSLDGWGSYGYDSSRDLASVTVPVSKSADLIEAFSIALYEASPGVVHLKAGWEHTVAEFPIKLL